MVKVYDFFSGCGGTSSGLQQAGLDIVMGLDLDRDSAQSFRANFPNADFIEADIRSLDVSALVPFVSAHQEKGEPILFCGCAPCQPFSKQNRNRTAEDPRRSLLLEFCRFVEGCLPDFVLVENVPGLQKISTGGPLDVFKERLTSLGYSYQVQVLPALWFGVPQTRERLVLLASRRGEIMMPEALHGDGKQPFSTVRDWIGNLPPLKSGESHPDDPLHVAAALSEINLTRIAATPEGGGRNSWPQELWLDCHKNHVGHTDVYGRLSWDKPAAGLTTKCISYSNGRFGHPVQHRAISLREAACLQTFPRDYKLVGGLGSMARQVGNAVPPLMAKALGTSILKCLK